MGETDLQITNTKYANSFSDSSFKKKIAKSAQKAGVKVVYTAYLLWLVLKSDTTSIKEKTLILIALGYFIAPLDLLPDVIPGGFVDDLAAILFALKRIEPNLTLDIINTAKNNTRKLFLSMDEDEFNKTINSIKVYEYQGFN